MSREFSACAGKHRRSSNEIVKVVRKRLSNNGWIILSSLCLLLRWKIGKQTLWTSEKDIICVKWTLNLASFDAAFYSPSRPALNRGLILNPCPSDITPLRERGCSLPSHVRVINHWPVALNDRIYSRLSTLLIPMWNYCCFRLTEHNQRSAHTRPSRGYLSNDSPCLSPARPLSQRPPQQ
jgi:hypothetical protein